MASVASAAPHLYLYRVGWLCPLFAKHLFSSARWIFVILHFLKPQIFWEIIKMFLSLIFTLAAIKNRMCWGVQKQSDCFWMIFPQPFPLPGGRKPLTPLCDTVNPCAIRWGCGQAGRAGRVCWCSWTPWCSARTCSSPTTAPLQRLLWAEVHLSWKTLGSACCVLSCSCNMLIL